jgi:hypothetical protein
MSDSILTELCHFSGNSVIELNARVRGAVSLIQFFGAESCQLADIHGRIHAVCGNACVSEVAVVEWHQKLCSG